MTTAEEMKRFIGKTIASVEYENGSDSAYFIFTDGYGLELKVEPTEEEESHE